MTMFLSECTTNDLAVRVILAEDDSALRNLIANHLSKDGFFVEQFGDAAALQKRLENLEKQDRGTDEKCVVVTDVHIPGKTALSLLEEMPGIVKTYPVILMTSDSDLEIRERAMELNAAFVLLKPFKLRSLSSKIKKAVAAKPTGHRAPSHLHI